MRRHIAGVTAGVSRRIDARELALIQNAAQIEGIAVELGRGAVGKRNPDIKLACRRSCVVYGGNADVHRRWEAGGGGQGLSSNEGFVLQLQVRKPRWRTR